MIQRPPIPNLWMRKLQPNPVPEFKAGKIRPAPPAIIPKRLARCSRYVLMRPMPASRPSANPFRNRLMKHAADSRQLLRITCKRCNQSVNYWAHDLVQVVGADHQVHVPPFPCSRCKTCEYLNVTWTVPNARELQALTVRRPVKQVVRWVWRDEKA